MIFRFVPNLERKLSREIRIKLLTKLCQNATCMLIPFGGDRELDREGQPKAGIAEQLCSDSNGFFNQSCLCACRSLKQYARHGFVIRRASNYDLFASFALDKPPTPR